MTISIVLSWQRKSRKSSLGSYVSPLLASSTSQSSLWPLTDPLRSSRSNPGLFQRILKAHCWFEQGSLGFPSTFQMFLYNLYAHTEHPSLPCLYCQSGKRSRITLARVQMWGGFKVKLLRQDCLKGTGSYVSDISLALVLGVLSERTRPRICGLLREMSPKYSMLTKHSTPSALAGMPYPMWRAAAVHTNKKACLKSLPTRPFNQGYNHHQELPNLRLFIGSFK